MAIANKWMIDPNDAVMELMESYEKAQSVKTVGRETKLDRLEAAEAKT